MVCYEYCLIDLDQLHDRLKPQQYHNGLYWQRHGVDLIGYDLYNPRYFLGKSQKAQNCLLLMPVRQLYDLNSECLYQHQYLPNN